MTPAKMTTSICSAVAVIGVLACIPAEASTETSSSGLCAVGIGAGRLHGTVVEPCGVVDRAVLRADLTPSDAEPPAPSAHRDPMIEIGSLFVSRILIRNALLSMVP